MNLPFSGMVLLSAFSFNQDQSSISARFNGNHTVEPYQTPVAA
jgi:hypothetical protein